MKCRYVALECTLGSRKCYGIAAVYGCDESMVILESITDLCLELNPVTALVDRCNSLGLSLCHLRDVVDDFLAEV